jgi:chromosome segregation ATPase
MADSRKRATVTSRASAPDAWEAGLHADSDAGSIDVGLSVGPSAVGVIIDAPGLGQLKLAFDVRADGTTRLARAHRRLRDGRDAVPVAVDEAKVLQLEGQLGRLQRQLEDERGVLVTERDEARDRADVMAEERDEVRRELGQAEAKLSEITAELANAREERLVARGQREQAREAVDELRAELALASARRQELELERDGLQAGAAQAAAALEVAQAELAALKAELAPLRATAAALEAAQASRAQLAAEHEATKSALAEAQATIESLRAVAVDPAELEGLRRAAAERDLLKPEHDAATTSRATLEASRAQLEADLARREDALAVAVGRVDELQSQLAAAAAAPPADAAAVKEAREVAVRLKAQADKLLAERDEARTIARQFHHKLKALGEGRGDRSHQADPTKKED